MKKKLLILWVIVVLLIGCTLPDTLTPYPTPTDSPPPTSSVTYTPVPTSTPVITPTQIAPPEPTPEPTPVSAPEHCFEQARGGLLCFMPEGSTFTALVPQLRVRACASTDCEHTGWLLENQVTTAWYVLYKENGDAWVGLDRDGLQWSAWTYQGEYYGWPRAHSDNNYDWAYENIPRPGGVSDSNLSHYFSVIRPDDAFVDEFVAGCPISVMVDGNASFAMELLERTAWCDTIVVYRSWIAGDDYKAFRTQDTDADVARWMAKFENTFQIFEDYSDRLVVMSFNELAGSNQDYQDYAEFEHRRILAMAERGYTAGVLALSTGTPPDMSVWGSPEFLGMLEACHEHECFILDHWYGAVHLPAWTFPGYEQGNLMNCERLPNGLCPIDDFPNPADVQGGWLVGRSQIVWDNVIEPHGWTKIRWIIQEAGWMAAYTPADEFYSRHLVVSYNDVCRAYQDYYDVPCVTQMQDELRWLDEYTRQHEWIWGIHVFVYASPSPSWDGLTTKGWLADWINDEIQWWLD